MKTILHIIWLVFFGIWLALEFLLVGILFCITIIGIPVGLELFKVSKYCISSESQTFQVSLADKPIRNILWLIFFGWWLAIPAFFGGAIMCITIIGIPVGLKYINIGKLLLTPVGQTVKL